MIEAMGKLWGKLEALCDYLGVEIIEERVPVNWKKEKKERGKLGKKTPFLLRDKKKSGIIFKVVKKEKRMDEKPKFWIGFLVGIIAGLIILILLFSN